MSFTVVAPQDFIQAVNNPILLTATKSDYQMGQFFYCEVWVTPNKDMHLVGNSLSGATMLVSFQRQGEGDKSCTFDISNVLASQFTASNYTVVNPQQRIQKDESSYVQWFVRMGWLYYNARNVAVKTQEYQSSGDNFAVRAALDGPLGAMGNYCNPYDYSNDTRIQFATRIPYNCQRGTSEPTLLSFFTPIIPTSTNRTLRVEADLQFADGTSEASYLIGTYPLPTGGLYVLNVKPDTLTNHLRYNDLVAYSVRVGYADDQAPRYLFFTDDHSFRLKKDIPNPRVVLFMNALGSWDALHFRRDFAAGLKPQTLGFRNTAGTRTYAVNSTRSLSYYSSYLDQAEYGWLEDLRVSPAIYVDGQYVRQTDAQDYKFDTTSGLFTYELNVVPGVDKNAVRF